MGIVFYNLYRCKDPPDVDDVKLERLNFMESRERGKRMGIYLNSIYHDDNGYYFKLCWDDRIEIMKDVGKEIIPDEMNTIIMKEMMIINRYIITQRGEEEKMEGFIRNNFVSNYHPYFVRVDEEMLRYIQDRAKKITGMTVINLSENRADKVKLRTTTKDLRKTREYEEIEESSRTSDLRIIFGGKDRHWADIRVGKGGNVGVSSFLSPREKIMVIGGVIEKYIEPKLTDITYQQTLV